MANSERLEIVSSQSNPAQHLLFGEDGLAELVRFLRSFSKMHGSLNDDDCLSLALGAFWGHAHAEFLVGTAYDAADEPMQAKLWFARAARRGFLPARLRIESCHGVQFC